METFINLLIIADLGLAGVCLSMGLVLLVRRIQAPPFIRDEVSIAVKADTSEFDRQMVTFMQNLRAMREEADKLTTMRLRTISSKEAMRRFQEVEKMIRASRTYKPKGKILATIQRPKPRKRK